MNTDARWYCVNRDGVATLCLDEEDARANAEHCDLAWPRGGPHRVLQLIDAAEVAAERERCATLARHALDAATDGNWAYAAVLLQRISGHNGLVEPDPTAQGS